MYLGRKYIQGKLYFFIRESYPDDDCMRSRDLFSLGPDPARYLVYPGGNAFFIDPVVEDSLRDQGIENDYDELEDIFWDFLKPDIQRAVEPFRLRQQRNVKRHTDRNAPAAENYQMFDRRRLYYLRTGRSDQSRIGLVPARLFKILRHKSRDEIEQQFLKMERVLRPDEIKTYVYTIFDLPHYFRESFARSAPHLLDQSSVDNFFIKEVCRLNENPHFWNGFEKDDGLHEYLVRYVIMFFDYDFNPGGLLNEYIRNFINSRRSYRPPANRNTVSLDEASRLFKKSGPELKKMGRRDLARLYRKRAMKLHPDKGGSHDRFVKLTEAYHGLMKGKP